MKDRTPRYPGRVHLTPVSGQANTYDLTRADSPIEEGTPINKQTLLTDETAYLLELKQQNPTVDDAFSHIAKNFVGDGGMNINLLEEMINMKYCKIIEASKVTADPWLAAGAGKCVCESYNGTYRYFARIVADTQALEVRQVNKSTGTVIERSIALPAVMSFARNSSTTTYWGIRIVPVVVRHSNHMIFMYTGGYYYNSNYYGRIGTVCFDTTTNTLVSIGSTTTTSSNWPSTGVGAYNYLNNSGYQGSMLANAVRTNSGYIRFWPGYNTNNGGYIYSMREGGSSFTSYTNRYASSVSEYSSYPCYVALYKNDYAHIAYSQWQYQVLFNGTSASDVANTNLQSITYYSAMSSLYCYNTNGNYSRSLTYSADGLKSYFTFQHSSSTYEICLWTNTSTSVAPVFSIVGDGSSDGSGRNNSANDNWALMTQSRHRFVASSSTLLTDRTDGRYAQSFQFAAYPANNCNGYFTSIASGDATPPAHTLPCSAGYVLNSDDDGIIAWNQYGQIYELKFFEQDTTEYESWECPEDGTYKILLVGGGAAGGASYGGGSGYMRIATMKLLEGDIIRYHVGRGGVYNAFVPGEAMMTIFGELTAMPASGNKGGADGASTPSGGGGGGYNLITYGGQGQNYNSATQSFSVSSSAATITTNGVVASKDRNGGQSANSGACTPGDGYGAGGGYCQNGKDGVIVILR